MKAETLGLCALYLVDKVDKGAKTSTVVNFAWQLKIFNLSPLHLCNHCLLFATYHNKSQISLLFLLVKPKLFLGLFHETALLF